MGFCACFRSDAHACAAVYADGVQRTQPFSFGGDLRAGTCFVDRNGPFGVYSVFICTYNGFNSAYHADAFHTESAVRCFFECPWTASYRTNQFERMARHADFSRDRNHRQRKHGIRCQSRSICFFIRHRVLSAMRKKTIGQAFAFAASHCAAGGFFICLFGLQKRVDELPVRRAENQLIRLSGNIRRPFRAWNQ